MYILTQKYQIILENLFKKAIKSYFLNMIPNFNYKSNVFDYVNFIQITSDSLNEFAKNYLIEVFELLDKDFKSSKERSKRYHLNKYESRTILTIFGEITYSRTFYKNIVDGSMYCPVDRMIGLNPNDYFDPTIKSLAIELTASNSYSEAGRIINNLIYKKFNIKNEYLLLSRQTIRNFILSAKLATFSYKKSEYPVGTIYIMADEHFVGSQFQDKDFMVKHAVIHEGPIKVTKNRNQLKNKHVFYSIDEPIANQLIDYIENVYDINKIKKIIILGDGANWIKSLKNEFKLTKDIEVVYVLDKFHFKQAVHHISCNYYIEKMIAKHVKNNNKKHFKLLINLLIKENPNRQKIITEKKKYILNNWNAILYLYNHNLSCPMESQISHNIVSRTSSRPRGFVKSSLDKLLTIKFMKINGNDIKTSYFSNYNQSNQVIINSNKNNIYNDSNRNKLTNKAQNQLNDFTNMKSPMRSYQVQY